MLLSVAVFIYIQFHLGLVVSSVTRWIRADFPTKILKFPQFFPTILRIPNLIVKFPKPKKSRIYDTNCPRNGCLRSLGTLA